jgi:hypothetical protein
MLHYSCTGHVRDEALWGRALKGPSFENSDVIFESTELPEPFATLAYPWLALQSGGHVIGHMPDRKSVVSLVSRRSLSLCSRCQTRIQGLSNYVLVRALL